MKHYVIWAAMLTACILEPAAAQQATASSNQSATSSSGSSSYGNVGNATTNNMAPTASATTNASADTSSTSSNNGNTQVIQFISNQPSAQQPGGTAGSTAATGTGQSAQGARQAQSAAAAQAAAATDPVTYTDNKVEYSGTQTIRNVPAIGAPALASSNDTCMGSRSGGVAVAGFGFTGGGTYVDEACRRLKMSRELWNKGMKAASLAMDCMDPDARTALELTGFTCPQTLAAQKQAQAQNHDLSEMAALRRQVAQLEAENAKERQVLARTAAAPPVATTTALPAPTAPAPALKTASVVVTPIPAPKVEPVAQYVPPPRDDGATLVRVLSRE